MISTTEAQQIANEAKKRADRSAEVERFLDQGLREAAGRQEVGAKVFVPPELRECVELALGRYRANGWTCHVVLDNADGILVDLTIVATREDRSRS